jgi:hypothetical protein
MSTPPLPFQETTRPRRSQPREPTTAPVPRGEQPCVLAEPMPRQCGAHPISVDGRGTWACGDPESHYGLHQCDNSSPRTDEGAVGDRGTRPARRGSVLQFRTLDLHGALSAARPARTPGERAERELSGVAHVPRGTTIRAPGASSNERSVATQARLAADDRGRYRPWTAPLPGTWLGDGAGVDRVSPERVPPDHRDHGTLLATRRRHAGPVNGDARVERRDLALRGTCVPLASCGSSNRPRARDVHRRRRGTRRVPHPSVSGRRRRITASHGGSLMTGAGTATHDHRPWQPG